MNLSVSPNRNRPGGSPTKEERKKAKIREKYANDDADSIAALSDQLFQTNSSQVVFFLFLSFIRNDGFSHDTHGTGMIEVILSKRNIGNQKFLQSVGFMKLVAYHQVPEKIKMFHKLLRLMSEKVLKTLKLIFVR